jgi:hypothetical protein
MRTSNPIFRDLFLCSEDDSWDCWIRHASLKKYMYRPSRVIISKAVRYTETCIRSKMFLSPLYSSCPKRFSLREIFSYLARNAWRNVHNSRRSCKVVTNIFWI